MIKSQSISIFPRLQRNQKSIDSLQIKGQDIRVNQTMLIQNEAQVTPHKDNLSQQKFFNFKRPVQQRMEQIHENIEIHNKQKRKDNNSLYQMGFKLDLHKSEINSRTDQINEMEIQLELMRQQFIADKGLAERQTLIIKDLTEQNAKLVEELAQAKKQYNDLSHTRQEHDNQQQQKLDYYQSDKLQEKLIFEYKIRELEEQKNEHILKISELTKLYTNVNNELTIINKKINEAELEREEAERQNLKSIGTSQSMVRELGRLRKEVDTLTVGNNELKKTVENQQDELDNFYSVKPTRSELIITVEKCENKNMSMQSLNLHLKGQVSDLSMQLDLVRSNLAKLTIECKDYKENALKLQDLYGVEKQQADKYTQDFYQSLKKIDYLNTVINQVMEKEDDIQDSILKLIKYEKDLGKSLKCNFCSNQLHETVTIIPCGHSYCLKCKDGYTGICSKCGPKVKIDAIYRNQLLDDIGVMFDQFQSLRKDLSGLAKIDIQIN